MLNPFKLTIAEGDAFCNRTAEKDLLCKNMRSGIHTVIYAPRRYGKTSLGQAVCSLLPNMECIAIDLFSVTSAEDVAEKIYRGIVNSLGQRATDKVSLATRILSVFKRHRLNIEINSTTSLPEFSVSLGEYSAELHLEQVIGALDQYCHDNGIKVCLVLDEFQEVCELSESKMVEGLLRAGMQVAKHVTFLMMGSRRTILRDMFEDRKRPFYKSSYVMELPRIPEEEFASFLVQRYWGAGKNLSHDEALELVRFVDTYPYYVQKLAMLHFDLAGESDQALQVAKKMLLEMELPDFEGIFLGLTNHQKRLLRAIAKHRPTSIHGQAFLATNRLGSQGGVQTSLAKLKKLDLVEVAAGAWRVVDPVFAKWLMGQ